MSLPLRRISREWALQLLYQLDLSHAEPSAATFLDFWSQLEETGVTLSKREWRKTRGLAEAIVGGVHANIEHIDGRVAAHAENWSLERITAVDRNIMRMAVYELLFCDEIPAPVSLNEAIEIAKAFGSDDSGAFVNGILDKINSEM